MNPTKESTEIPKQIDIKEKKKEFRGREGKY